MAIIGNMPYFQTNPFVTCLKFPVRQVQVPLETMTTTAALTQSLSVKCVKLLEASAAMGQIKPTGWKYEYP